MSLCHQANRPDNAFAVQREPKLTAVLLIARVDIQKVGLLLKRQSDAVFIVLYAKDKLSDLSVVFPAVFFDVHIHVPHLSHTNSNNITV